MGEVAVGALAFGELQSDFLQLVGDNLRVPEAPRGSSLIERQGT